MAEVKIKEIVEALIMASDDPLGLDKISKILKSNNHQIETKELREIFAELTEDYSERSLELKEVASGFRFQVKSEFSFWISKLHEERPPRYSRALLETLALIAYRQPITRSEIEDVRGVSVGSNIVKTLLDHDWVKVVGHKEVPGRPALFATTKNFLDHFNLKSLSELPPLEEFTEDVANEALVEEVEEGSVDNGEVLVEDGGEEGGGEDNLVDNDDLPENNEVQEDGGDDMYEDNENKDAIAVVTASDDVPEEHGELDEEGVAVAIATSESLDDFMLEEEMELDDGEEGLE